MLSHDMLVLKAYHHRSTNTLVEWVVINLVAQKKDVVRVAQRRINLFDHVVPLIESMHRWLEICTERVSRFGWCEWASVIKCLTNKEGVHDGEGNSVLLLNIPI